MKSRKTLLIGAALSVAVAVLMLSGTVLVGAAPAEVKDKAQKFSNGRALELVEVSDGAFSGLKGLGQYKDKKSGDDFVWDTKGGFIRRYAKPSTYEKRGKGEAMTAAEARRIAESWAKRCYDGGSLESMKVKDGLKSEGDGSLKEWEIEFRRYAGDVPTFDYFKVVLDAVTGEVMFIEQDWGALSETTQPQVSRDEAVKAGADALGVAASSCTSARLRVVRSLDGVQMLVWVVTFEVRDSEYAKSALALVDAHDGTIVDTGKSW